MSQQKPIKAHEIVTLFASLLGIDVTAIANVIGNMPRANVRAWLAGKKENLRTDSVVKLMDLVGLQWVQDKVRLDPNRVHMWRINDRGFGGLTRPYENLRRIARLLDGCAITRVEPVGARRSAWVRSTHSIYLLSGPAVRVVVEIRKGPFRKMRLTPEYLKGTMWREESIEDDVVEHVIHAPRGKWSLLLERDLTTMEFDQIFECAEPRMNWADVAMSAREYSITPDEVARWILDHDRDRRGRQEKAPEGVRTDERVILLSHHRSEASTAAA